MSTTIQLNEDTKLIIDEEKIHPNQSYNEIVKNVFIKYRMIKKIEDDLKFAKSTEDAWKRYDEGKFTSSTKEEFLKELRKC